MKIKVMVTDLWGDPEGGYSANCSWVRETIVDVPDGASDLSIRRKIKKEAGLQHMRTDYWSGDEWCWRDGCVGASAYVED